MSWFNKKQHSVSTSTAEAEYIAAGSCCAQVLWMRNQLFDYGFKLKKIPIERSVKDLTSRMEAIEKTLGLVLQNQITQAELLGQLLATHFGSSSLPMDDNKKGEKEKESQQIKKADQQLKSGKRKSSSTSDQPIQKKAKQGLEAIEERRKLREAQTKDQAEQDKKQLGEIQRKTKEIISAVEKGVTIQTGPVVDNSIQSSKEYGSPSGAMTLGTNIATSPAPQKPKGKNLFQEDIFPEPKDDSQKILGNSIKEIKNRGDAKDMFATIFRNGKEIKVYCTHTYFHEAKNEENKRLGLLSLEE